MAATSPVNARAPTIGASTINRPVDEGLPDREALLALFFEQAPLAIAMFDTGMRFLAVSRRFLSELAPLFSAPVFAPAEVVGRTRSTARSSLITRPPASNGA
jgi:hypothetical protein